MLLRFGGLVAMVNTDGVIQQVLDGGRPLVEGARPFIVKDDRWWDFEYVDVEHAVADDGTLTFSGKRKDGEMEIGFTQEIRTKGRALTVVYRCEALTDMHAHMWRHQLDLPVAAFAGGMFRAGGQAQALPVDLADEPTLAQGAGRISATSPDGAKVTVKLSGKGQLVDERHYGAQGYRVGLHPVNGDLVKGDVVEVTIRVEAR